MIRAYRAGCGDHPVHQPSKEVDAKARSKWVRALIFATKYKSPAEPLEDFIRRHGGINSCVAELSRLSRSNGRLGKKTIFPELDTPRLNTGLRTNAG